MIDAPELRPNQFGVTVKVFDNGYGKLNDELLYVTVNKNDISLELFPKKPVISIDKDAAKMILGKIAEVDGQSAEAALRSTVDLPEEGLPPDDNTTISAKLAADHFNGGQFNNRIDYVANPLLLDTHNPEAQC